MCKNTRISGLKFGLIASLLNMSTSPTLYSEIPWVIFCCRDDKDVKILPGNILSEGKKCAPLEKLFYSFGATAGIDCSLQRVGKTIYAVCYETGADPGFSLGRGALVSCSTSTPINHIVFFGRIPVVLENRRSSQGGGLRTPCTLPLDLPLRNGSHIRCLLCQ